MSLTLAFALLLIPSGVAASAETADGNTVLYSAAEITDVDALIQRSIAGIDDLKENTGYELSVTTTEPSRSAFSLSSPEVQRDYVSSQLLRSELVDGKRIDTYAAKVVKLIGPYHVEEESGELLSTMYVTADSDLRIRLIETTAKLSGGGAARLVMTNGYKEDAIHDLITTSSQYSNPGTGIFTLNRCCSDWVTDSTGLLYLRNMVHYNSGSVTKTEFVMSRDLHTQDVNW